MAGARREIMVHPHSQPRVGQRGIERQRLFQVLDRGQYVLGPEVEAFEQEFARAMGVPEAAGVASGTDALMLALRAAGIGRGDGVLTVSLTAVAKTTP